MATPAHVVVHGAQAAARLRRSARPAAATCPRRACACAARASSHAEGDDAAAPDAKAFSLAGMLRRAVVSTGVAAALLAGSHGATPEVRRRAAHPQDLLGLGVVQVRRPPGVPVCAPSAADSARRECRGGTQAAQAGGGHGLRHLRRHRRPPHDRAGRVRLRLAHPGARPPRAPAACAFAAAVTPVRGAPGLGRLQERWYPTEELGNKKAVVVIVRYAPRRAASRRIAPHRATSRRGR
eukprot:scaffold1138_cov217-Prasinococcus_capsulatus_cf.AAC.3